MAKITKEIKNNKEDEKLEAATGDLVVNQLSKFLKENKEEHYNFSPDVQYKVSSGSLNLDMEIGGFSPGIVRLVGGASGGKTSTALEVARNFLATVPNSRVLHVLSEGRLSQNHKDRSGLKFVSKAEDWAVGTCFLFETNIYEVVIGLLRELIMNNPTDCRYMFILDSADSMNLRNDYIKKVDEANKVAGSPLMTKQLLQKIGLAMVKFGHMCFFIGQVSSEIKLDPYAKTVPRQVGGSGGNAVQHFANEVLEFMERYEGDLILEDPQAKIDRTKNRIIGHTCKIKLKKSNTEKRFTTIEVPIRHGQINGNSVWREREIVDQLLVWGLITRSGAWTKTSPKLQEEIKVLGLSIPEQFQGMDKVYTYLDENKEVTKFLFEKFKKMVGGG